MKIKWLSSLMTTVILVSSCAKDDATNNDGVLHFNGKINNLQATTTTGASTAWAQNDQIGIFMTNTGASTVTENNSNKQYSFTGNQFSAILGNEMFYPVNDSKVDFIAYYPYKSGYSLGSPVVLDLKDQSDLSKLDLLYAKSNNGGQGYSKTAGVNVPLTFDHKLSKIIIKPVAGQGMNALDASWTNMKVVINGLNSQGNFDLKAGIVSSVSSPVVIYPFTRTAGTTYESIVIPYQYVAAGTVSFNFEIGTDTFVWNSPANETFDSGKEYTYTITVNKTGVTLGSVTINDWASVYRAGTAL